MVGDDGDNKSRSPVILSNLQVRAFSQAANSVLLGFIARIVITRSEWVQILLNRDRIVASAMALGDGVAILTGAWLL